MPPKKNKTVAELKEECKKKGITGYSGKTKDELIKLCSRATSGSKKKASSKKKVSSKKYKDKTVAELKEECKKKGIAGYSGKTKDKLIKMCSKATSGSGKKESSKKGSSSKNGSSSKKKKDKTVAELKEECKKKGITGYSGKKKDELIKLCSKSGKKKSLKDSKKETYWSLSKLVELPSEKNTGEPGEYKNYIIIYKINNSDWRFLFKKPAGIYSALSEWDYLVNNYLKNNDVRATVKFIECNSKTRKCRVMESIRAVRYGTSYLYKGLSFKVKG